MSDLSHPTSRVLDVITFLAGHPTEEFSLADIAQQTAMSKASAHRVLLTLADADFLARHAKRKTSSLGMGLLAVGQASLEKYSGERKHAVWGKGVSLRVGPGGLAYS